MYSPSASNAFRRTWRSSDGLDCTRMHFHRSSSFPRCALLHTVLTSTLRSSLLIALPSSPPPPIKERASRSPRLPAVHLPRVPPDPEGTQQCSKVLWSTIRRRSSHPHGSADTLVLYRPRLHLLSVRNSSCVQTLLASVLHSAPYSVTPCGGGFGGRLDHASLPCRELLTVSPHTDDVPASPVVRSPFISAHFSCIVGRSDRRSDDLERESAWRCSEHFSPDVRSTAPRAWPLGAPYDHHLP